MGTGPVCLRPAPFAGIIIVPNLALLPSDSILASLAARLRPPTQWAFRTAGRPLPLQSGLPQPMLTSVALTKRFVTRGRRSVSAAGEAPA